MVPEPKHYLPCYSFCLCHFQRGGIVSSMLLSLLKLGSTLDISTQESFERILGGKWFPKAILWEPNKHQRIDDNWVKVKASP